MDDITDRLRQVLAIAATAPGNHERFLAAGLIQLNPQQPVTLVAHWQEAFSRLRPVQRETVRANPGLFLATAHDVVYRGITSGSQGQHLVYFAGQAWNHGRLEARRRSLAWWGIDDRTPILNLASRLLPLRPIDGAIAGPLTPAFDYRLLTLLADRPVALRGYPSRLCEVALRLSTRRIPPVLAVICTGERLFDPQKALLEEIFCAPVANEYGCQETGVSGLTCPEAGRLHLDGDRCLYEVIDGHLVTTDLFNWVMPMVRYQCGDSLTLDTSLCSCGRPGPTAHGLRRAEDQHGDMSSGVTHPILLPKPAPLLHRQTGLNVKSEVSFANLSAALTLPLEPAIPMADQENSDRPDMDAHTWIHAITSGSWASWLANSQMPTGSLRPVAHLLWELIHPSILYNSGLPPTTNALLQSVLEQAPSPDPVVEHLTARVLLFACSFLADQPTRAATVYQQAAARLHHAIAPSPHSPSPHSPSPAAIDLLIPALYLEYAASAWTAPLSRGAKLDSFTIHHLLHAFEPAVQRAIASGTSPVLPALRPLLAVLIGDLQFFAPRYGNWLLAHWLEVVRGAPVQWVETPVDDFSRAWLAWRQQLIWHPHEATLAEALSNLVAVARSPQEHARVNLERGYGVLVTGQSLAPEEWLRTVQHHTRATSGDQRRDTVDPMPWTPILKALAPLLLSQGKQEAAYACLVAATVPSSKVSAFDRLASQASGKQWVVFEPL